MKMFLAAVRKLWRYQT